MKLRDQQLLKKAILECEDIVRYTCNIEQHIFLSNDLLQKAIAMSLLNLGEYVNKFSDEVLTLSSDIPWKKIIGLRNIVAHGYGELKMELVWNLTQNEIPLLAQKLHSIKNSL